MLLKLGVFQDGNIPSRQRKKNTKVSLSVKVLQANSSGLVVSLKTKMFGLRVPQEEILQFYLKNYTNFQMCILSDWDI